MRDGPDLSGRGPEIHTRPRRTLWWWWFLKLRNGHKRNVFTEVGFGVLGHKEGGGSETRGRLQIFTTFIYVTGGQDQRVFLS